MLSKEISHGLLMGCLIFLEDDSFTLFILFFSNLRNFYIFCYFENLQIQIT